MDGPQWMASAMRAARAQLEIATQNLANAATDGFRAARAQVTLGERGLRVGAAPAGEQGGLRMTGRAFDLALLGPGGLPVAGGTTREGAFSRSDDGRLLDRDGRALQGRRGDLRVPPGATIAADGTVRDGARAIDRIPLPAGSVLRSGAVETSSVNAIEETLAIVNAQRAFETAQKTLAAIDQTRQKAANDVGRLS